MSACDEDITTADAAFETTGDAAASLKSKLTQYCPALADIPIAHRWAGARTFSPDSRPVLTWDSQAPQFLWVAALGGHGATTSATIGRKALSLLAQNMTHHCHV